MAAGEVEPDRGPVMVTVENRVDPKERKAFLAAISEFGPQRRRDGAFAWGIFEDAAEEGRFVETFMVEPRIEHLRQHERVTDADRVLQEAVQRFHPGAKPTVTHLIAAELPHRRVRRQDRNHRGSASIASVSSRISAGASPYAAPPPPAALAVSLLVPDGPAAAQAPERPEYERLRYEEDWSVLRDPTLRTDPFDPLKYIPLNESGDAYLSFGGEVRERYEYTHNPVWGDDPQDDHGVFLQRYVLFGDLHLGPHVRVFGELYSALENGREGPSNPIDENQLDVQQAFLDLSAPALIEDMSATVRLGRQEMSMAPDV